MVKIVLMSTCLVGYPKRQHCWLAMKRKPKLSCFSRMRVSLTSADPTQPTHLDWAFQLNHWVKESRPSSVRPLPAPSDSGQPSNGSPVCDCASEQTCANQGNHAVVYTGNCKGLKSLLLYIFLCPHFLSFQIINICANNK